MNQEAVTHLTPKYTRELIETDLDTERQDCLAVSVRLNVASILSTSLTILSGHMREHCVSWPDGRPGVYEKRGMMNQGQQVGERRTLS